MLSLLSTKRFEFKSVKTTPVNFFRPSREIIDPGRPSATLSVVVSFRPTRPAWHIDRLAWARPCYLPRGAVKRSRGGDQDCGCGRCGGGGRDGGGGRGGGGVRERRSEFEIGQRRRTRVRHGETKRAAVIARRCETFRYGGRHSIAGCSRSASPSPFPAAFLSLAGRYPVVRFFHGR